MEAILQLMVYSDNFMNCTIIDIIESSAGKLGNSVEEVIFLEIEYYFDLQSEFVSKVKPPVSMEERLTEKQRALIKKFIEIIKNEKAQDWSDVIIMGLPGPKERVDYYKNENYEEI